MGRKSTVYTIRIPDEILDAYRAAAAAVGVDSAAWIREYLREGVPTMLAIAEAHKQDSVGPLQSFMRQTLADAHKAVDAFSDEHTPNSGVA